MDNTALYTKLAWVMSQVGRIPKNGWNDFHKYKFATDNDVADTIRALLVEQKIAFFAQMIDVHQDVYEQTNDKGKVSYSFHTRAAFEFTFACGDTGASITLRWYGEASDTGDKGINKSATAAEKYFLLKTFMVSTGDDPDAASGEVAGKSKTDGREIMNREKTRIPPPMERTASKPVAITDWGKQARDWFALTSEGVGFLETIRQQPADDDKEGWAVLMRKFDKVRNSA